MLCCLILTTNILWASTDSTKITISTVDGELQGSATSPLRCDPTGTTVQPVSGTIAVSSGSITSTPSGTQDINSKQINGITIAVGAGSTTTGVQRVVLAGDQFVTTNLSALNNNTPIAAGAGNSSVGTQRVVIATDQAVIPISDNAGSLTVDGSVGRTWSSAVGTDSIDAVPGRPTQKSGRVYKDGTLANQTADVTLYTVTAGKTLYVTSMSMTAINAGGTDGVITIEDNTTDKLSVNIPSGGLGAAEAIHIMNGMTWVFPEPKRFSTSIHIDEVQGNTNFSIEFTGYEE